MLIRSPTRVYRSWVADSRRWNDYRPRAGDVIIATYPKSGTTWMQQIVGLLIFQSPEPRPVAEIAPWFDRREPDETSGALMHRLDAQQHRRFIKCHTPFDGVPVFDEVKYIHVARDGRDACLSFHNHCVGFSERQLASLDANGLADDVLGRLYPRAPADPAEFFRRWMREGIGDETDGVPFHSWFHFEQTYWAARQQPNVLLVHYRDLKTDLEGEMRRIATFLDIETPEAIWPKLVKAATFSEMRSNGAKLAPTMMQRFAGGAERFFQLGINDRWKGVLSADDLAAYDARVRERFEEASAAWLHLGRLGSTG